MAKLKRTPAKKALKPLDKICSICFKPYTEYGNNAQPINDGRACDQCDTLVIIARINRLSAR